VTTDNEVVCFQHYCTSICLKEAAYEVYVLWFGLFLQYNYRPKRSRIDNASSTTIINPPMEPFITILHAHHLASSSITPIITQDVPPQAHCPLGSPHPHHRPTSPCHISSKRSRLCRTSSLALTRLSPYSPLSPPKPASNQHQSDATTYCNKHTWPVGSPEYLCTTVADTTWSDPMSQMRSKCYCGRKDVQTMWWNCYYQAVALCPRDQGTMREIWRMYRDSLLEAPDDAW
jgi:hypothetical protein